MKTTTKKMSLKKESLRMLSKRELGSAGGGFLTICASCGPFCQGPKQSSSLSSLIETI